MTPENYATIYAAMKLLQNQLEDEPNLPAGFKTDLSGQTITIKFPPNTIVSRDVGEKHDGKILKKATQDLYGYAVWALMVSRLSKFHQWNAIKQIIIDCVQVVLKSKGKTVREQLEKTQPQIIEMMNELQQEMAIPSRPEDTPKLVSYGLPPTITIK